MINKRTLRNDEEQQTTTKKLKSSRRTILLLREYKKWSSNEVISLLRTDSDNGLSQNNVIVNQKGDDKKEQILQSIDGSTFDNIVKSISKNDIISSIDGLNNWYPKVNRKICTSIVFWVNNNLMPFIGYDEWSAEEVLEKLQQKRIYGDANIFQQLM